jgi:hypothetical protein
MAISNISSSSALTGKKDSLAWDQATSMGSYWALQSYTAKSFESSVMFSNIPQNFSHLEIRMSAKHLASGEYDVAIFHAFNGDMSVGNYSVSRIGASGNAANAGSNGTGSYTIYSSSQAGGQIDRGLYAPTVTNIYDYSSSSKYKILKTTSGFSTNFQQPTDVIWMAQGTWYNTSPINSITLYSQSVEPWAPGTKIALYGIK